jgi:hypothetical protein
MAASRIRELTADGREYALNLSAQGDQDGDGDDGDKGENQGILHKCLTFPIFTGAIQFHAGMLSAFVVPGQGSFQ